MVKDKDKQLVGNNFISDVLGDIGVDKTPPKMCMMKKEITCRNNCVRKNIYCFLVNNVVGRNLDVLSKTEYDNVRK